jgi:hypothetical protein
MKRKTFSLETLQEAATTHPHKRAAAKSLGICTETFCKLLQEHNIEFIPAAWEKPKQFKGYPEINEQWLIDNWVNTTKSIKTLADEIGIPDSVIESRISSYKLRKSHKHSFNAEKFFNIQDPHIWYVAGLAATDGYFPKHFDGVEFSLVGNDEYNLLNSMREYYESQKEVVRHHTATRKNDWYWLVSAYGIKEFFFETFNIPARNKTFDLDIPKSFPSEDCAKAYIRGCIDGDGSIAVDGKSVRVCTASEAFVKGLGEVVEKYTGIGHRFFFIAASGYSKGKLYPAVEWNSTRAKPLLDWVYSLEDCFKLERKYQRYLVNKTV